MPLSARNASQADAREVTHTRSPRKQAARVVAFTRHPTAVAVALGFLLGLPLRASDRLVAEILITRCDREGLYWGKVAGELAALTGLSPNTIRVCLRNLRKHGVVEWHWVKPHARLPARKSYREPASWARGARLPHGGRVCVVRWEKLGTSLRSRPLGTNLAGLICGDQSGLIPTDQPSDLLGSPSENLSSTARGAPPASPGAASPPEPRRSTEDGRSQAPAPPPSRPSTRPPSPHERPPARTIDSETPGAAAAALASNDGPGSRKETETRQGDWRHSERSERETPARLTRAELEASLAWLYRPGTAPPPSPPDRRRRK